MDGMGSLETIMGTPLESSPRIREEINRSNTEYNVRARNPALLFRGWRDEWNVTEKRYQTITEGLDRFLLKISNLNVLNLGMKLQISL